MFDHSGDTVKLDDRCMPTLGLAAPFWLKVTGILIHKVLPDCLTNNREALQRTFSDARATRRLPVQASNTNAVPRAFPCKQATLTSQQAVETSSRQGSGCMWNMPERANLTSESQHTLSRCSADHTWTMNAAEISRPAIQMRQVPSSASGCG